MIMKWANRKNQTTPSEHEKLSAKLISDAPHPTGKNYRLSSTYFN